MEQEPTKEGRIELKPEIPSETTDGQEGGGCSC